MSQYFKTDGVVKMLPLVTELVQPSLNFFWSVWSRVSSICSFVACDYVDSVAFKHMKIIDNSLAAFWEQI